MVPPLTVTEPVPKASALVMLPVALPVLASVRLVLAQEIVPVRLSVPESTPIVELEATVMEPLSVFVPLTFSNDMPARKTPEHVRRRDSLLNIRKTIP